ncbi:unnamed protein product [Vitrella brassicaformis CCMP3155]|uniref:Methyltransferase domain-containing protein n=1 Tax=Vitrella brassicaformis (strain CCMP3155) TaxID=1169540 RepID=A0A0G4G8B0_VITBC|nr:unnamed protein product [Vitrella brassicaformis CCMP3155]|eukprot:CEM24761.1 unnamed protein product [Vitrella brassicaformis CCMP3155]
MSRVARIGQLLLFSVAIVLAATLCSGAAIRLGHSKVRSVSDDRDISTISPRSKHGGIGYQTNKTAEESVGFFSVGQCQADDVLPMNQTLLPESFIESIRSGVSPDCKQFIKGINGKLPPPEDLLSSLDATLYHDMQDTLQPYSHALEGKRQEEVEQVRTFVDLASLPFVKTICEIGFNTGHSSYMLTSNQKARVVSFDIGRHPYTRKVAELFAKRYGHRFTLAFGDSRITVPEFHRTHPDVTCDLMLVDGGHTRDIALSDLSMPEICEAWRELRVHGAIEESYSCEFSSPKRGVSLGYYTFPK